MIIRALTIIIEGALVLLQLRKIGMASFYIATIDTSFFSMGLRMLQNIDIIIVRLSVCNRYSL